MESTFAGFGVESVWDAPGGVSARHGEMEQRKGPSWDLLVGWIIQRNFQKLPAIGRTPVFLCCLLHLYLFPPSLFFDQTRTFCPSECVLYSQPAASSYPQEGPHHHCPPLSGKGRACFGPPLITINPVLWEIRC